MPQVDWTAKVHRTNLIELQPFIASSLDLELQQRQCRDGYVLFREAGVPHQYKQETVIATFHWKDSHSSLCHISVSSNEQNHPESTCCWEVALQLRRLLRPTEP